MTYRIYSDGRIYGATVPERLMLLSRPVETGCREWTGRMDKGGYGLIDVDRKGRLAHRVSYEAFVGPIDGDLTVDHMCFNRRCIEPSHLRLLTLSQNSSNRRPASHCKRGHEFTPDNTIVWGRKRPSRVCVTCMASRRSPGWITPRRAPVEIDPGLVDEVVRLQGGAA